ncbi:DUF3368 domain-containing protein [bacterium]|nr:DUF3368 domain-containing protein [Verrucomicrobiota bacterium]MDA7632607.1 DUF3368 domain-containing protein [bacterium]
MSRSLAPVVVADASPLIGLAKIGKLKLLEALFQQLLIPGAVEGELCLDSGRPGARHLAEAKMAGWLVTKQVFDVPKHLTFTVDQGEAEAITLAIQESALLLIDESKGRLAATSEGVRIFGTGAMLIRAKERGLIDCVSELLIELTEIGYHFSIALQQEILKRAGE